MVKRTIRRRVRTAKNNREIVQITNRSWTRCDVFYMPMEVWFPSSRDDCWLTLYVLGGYYFGSVDQER